MPENDQLQQNNFVQNQQHIEETTQQITQQNNIEGVQQDLHQTTENQVQKTKERPAWLNIILSVIFWLLWIGIITLSLYEFFSYNWSHDFEDYAELCLILLVSILIIFTWVLIFYNSKVEAYYHPTWLTKILSWFLRFLWISLIRSGLWSFSLIPSEYYSNWEILLAWWSITLCWIWFIIFWILLYCTKKLVNMWITFLLSIIITIWINWTLDKFWDDFYRHYDDEINISLIIFMLYFLILSIIWWIRCFRLKKRWKTSGKILNKESSSKKIWYITTGILLLILIGDIIYGKIQWSKIPEIDESVFKRDYHQTKLPDEEDALVQLRGYNSWSMSDVMIPLESYYYYLFSDNYKENNKDITRKLYPEECIVINSWWNEYCGTWAWNNNTLERSLNNYYYMDPNYYKKFVDDNWYISVNWKKATIFEYIQKNEPEIRKSFQELDRITSLDYYLPDNEILNLIPAYLQWYTRVSIVALQYYIYQEDWDMVMFIIKLNYKIVDIFNTTWSFINQLISLVIQWIMDDGINSYIKLFPKDFRNELLERYSTKTYNKYEMYDYQMRWEYVTWNWARDNNILLGDWNGEPLYQFLFHFPFFSAKEINNMMNYSYYSLWKEPDNYSIEEMVENLLYTKSLYNRYWKQPYGALMPRMHTVFYRMDKDIYHKEALIKNLKSGKYDVWFNEKDYENDSRWFENLLIPTYKEINKEVIKEYSDIINPCFWKDILNSDKFWSISGLEFWNICSKVLSKINEEEDDKFLLKDILIKITQLWIDYNESLIEQSDCRERIWWLYWDKSYICETMYDEQDEILNLMETSYFELLEVLENIESEIWKINIDEYFYIPEIIYNKRDMLNNSELNNTKSNNLQLENIELPESFNIIKKYSDIINPCFWKDIIDPVPDIGFYHEDFEKICLNTMKELKEQEKDDFWLKDILIEITKSLINYSKFEVKVDACWLEEWVVPHICNEISDKEEELVNKIKENYIKLSDILENIKNENPWINIDDYFYIPYEKINDDGNLLIIGFFIDEEKSKEILNNIKLQEAIDKINKSEQKILSSNKSNEQLNYEKLANLTNICIWEDILNWKIKLSYDNHTDQCDYMISELEKKNLT